LLYVTSLSLDVSTIANFLKLARHFLHVLSENGQLASNVRNVLSAVMSAKFYVAGSTWTRDGQACGHARCQRESNDLEVLWRSTAKSEESSLRFPDPGILAT
jgi:hypothetical protein